jgi:aconitase A
VVHFVSQYLLYQLKHKQPLIDLKDIWPSIKEVSDTVDTVVTPDLFKEEYETVYNNNEMWNEIDVTDQPLDKPWKNEGFWI